MEETGKLAAEGVLSWTTEQGWLLIKQDLVSDTVTRYWKLSPSGTLWYIEDTSGELSNFMQVNRL
jgi:hypothetical protein